jgi:ADP-ribose pyrophosphatase
MTAWRVLERRTLLARRWLEVEEQRIALPHGGEIDEFHLIKAPDWVAVIALTPQNEAVCVEQYRHGAARVCLELPAGVIDEGEEPIETARRELLEETGHAVDTVEPLVTVHTEPSRHTNRAHFFFARGARLAREQSLDASENIRVRLVSAEELVRAALEGEIIHGLHVAAILLAVRRGLLPG